jgi:RHS repeat-associated protein
MKNQQLAVQQGQGAAMATGYKRNVGVRMILGKALVGLIGLGLALPCWSAVSLSAPANNALYLAPLASTAVRASATAPSGTTIVQVEFYANGVLIGTDTAPDFFADWTNVPAGTYTLTAKLIDSNGGTTTSAPRTVTVAASNTPPTVSLSTPTNNASYVGPVNVSASATAAGPEINDILQRVEFYLNGTLAATVTQAPFSTMFTSLANGSYTLTAVAVDGQGAQTTSAARTFTVGTNQPPTIAITTPLDNSKWHSPAGFTFQTMAAAPETNDTVAVEFFANGNSLGTRTNAPYSWNVSSLTAGTYVLTATATDGQGLQTQSAPRTIIVSDTNNAPTITLTAPTANANYPSPATSIPINATANAGEVNGWITRVEFYVNGVLTNTDTAGPFSFNWTNVPNGSYTLTAKAVDQLNAETVSTPINITVGAAAIYFIHTDQLNTPRTITNAQGSTVWTWANDDPFGNNAPNENPSGQGNFTCNLRLPGQYFDLETSLHYNYFRDYNPAIGRYVESDPIGLRGGPNTYAFVLNDPISKIDPRGLIPPNDNIAGIWDSLWNAIMRRSATSAASKVVGDQCGQKLCQQGTGPAGSNFRDASVRYECLRVTTMVPVYLATPAQTECESICNTWVNNCQKPKVGSCPYGM